MSHCVRFSVTRSGNNAMRLFTSVLKYCKHGYCLNYKCGRNISMSTAIHQSMNAHSHVYLDKTKLLVKSGLNTNHFHFLVQRRCMSTLYSLVQPMTVSHQREVPKHIKRPSYIERGIVTPVGKRIPIKTKKQIDKMRSSCSLARDILNKAGEAVKVGVTTDDIDGVVHRQCIDNNAYPSPLLYKGFPKSVCTSVNNVACHGIPDRRPLMDGDIINVDVTVYYNGYHGDCSETYLVGCVDDGGRVLVDVARQCRDAAIAVCQPGVRFCEIGNTISAVATGAGFSVIPQFCGHGIGEDFHELPDIFHFEHYDDKVMKEGMIFTVEPIICDGNPDITILADGWTAVTCDNSRSAQFEHTVLITANGVEVLTL